MITVLKINEDIQPFYNHTDYQSAYDTLQVKLCSLTWFSSKKLLQWHSKAAQADITLLVKWNKLLSDPSSVQRAMELRQCCISCMMQDTGENSCIWYLCGSSCITDCDQLKLGKQIQTGVACCEISSPLMLHPTSHCGDYYNPTSDSVEPSQCHVACECRAVRWI